MAVAAFPLVFKSKLVQGYGKPFASKYTGVLVSPLLGVKAKV